MASRRARLLPTRRVRVAVAAVLLVGAGVVLAGCGALDPDPEPSCAPGPIAVSPATVAPGGTVTVSSGKVDCAVERRYSHYELRLTSMRDDAPLGSVEAGPHGEFRTTVTIPADAHAGDASVVVSGSTYDYCPRHAGPNADCAAYYVTIKVVPG